MTDDAPVPEPAAELPRLTAFLAGFARRQAPVVRELPCGFVVLDEELRHSRADNQVFVDRPPAEPAALPELADGALAGLPHRLLTVLDDGVARAAAPALAAAGYEQTVDVLMVHRGPVPAPGPGPRRAAEVDLAALRGPLTRRWRGFLPDADEETVRQLVERRNARHRGAPAVRFIGSPAADGAVASWADLYLDPAAGLAQIEDVLTAEAHLGHGHGTAVLTEALRQAAAAGCPTRFLIAEADDWPRHWYRRLGFRQVGRIHTFERG
ncbi:GNAT family N-acetyltransferase [Streptomyces sp. DSM 44915]|uniref:GNAT family N-acetyltransferase n=1 Tax=Streptomyces chisholmiae TaxID=3075540 RepID=A0ABU2JP60_9ACTN|nr:GNAT family N-acetyltransferase [Streptomyces sp. DSM 44915]MDT0266499.1 GNAT family N-acetyltransferase [Streptomyces sp. DSM 44915]